MRIMPMFDGRAVVTVSDFKRLLLFDLVERQEPYVSLNSIPEQTNDLLQSCVQMHRNARLSLFNSDVQGRLVYSNQPHD